MDRRGRQVASSVSRSATFSFAGIRAFVGFKQTGVDYVRPERMFGVTTNNLTKNIGWAKKGLLSFSNTPLNMLSAAGVALFLLSVILGVLSIGSRLLFPDLAPRGYTSLVLTVIFFGSINILAISILGEYMPRYRRGETPTAFCPPSLHSRR